MDWRISVSAKDLDDWGSTVVFVDSPSPLTRSHPLYNQLASQLLDNYKDEQAFILTY